MSNFKRRFFRILAREERLDIITPIIKKAKKKKSEKRTPTKPDLWNRAKSEAKKRFKVWPSAYCVPLSSEALTKDGWKNYHQIKKDEDILSFNIKTQEFVWSPIKEIYFYTNQATLKLHNNDKTIEIICTPEHKWVTFDKDCVKFEKTEALSREGYLKGLKNITLSEDKSFTSDDEIIFLSNIIIEKGDLEDVWCPETKYKSWIMRQGDKIIITGNSSGWAVKWYKERGGGWRGKKPIK